MENLQEESFITQRLVQDHIRSKGGILNVAITKEMIISAASSRQRYCSHLREAKQKTEETNELKRKNKLDELDGLRKKETYPK